LLRAAVFLIVLFAGSAVVSALNPSEVRVRGQSVAQAWINGDAATIEPFVEQRYQDEFKAWWHKNPAPKPEITDDYREPTVLVTVESNDGKYAKVLIRVKARAKDNSIKNYLFYHRWVNRGGTWYFQPG
jgi:hypothetical protein